MTAGTANDSLAARLADVERHLERLLASGWRNAAPDRAGLGTIADELTELGLPDFAERLRAIDQAGDPAEALQRIAVATAACRMLQARLMAPPPASPTLRPIPAPKERTGPRLLVIAPLSVGGQSVWACARLERGVAAELVLLESPPTAEATAAPEANGRGFLRQIMRQPQSASAEPTPWLRAELHLDLEWRATLPLSSGTVDLRAPIEECALLCPEEKDDVAAHARGTLHAGKASDHDVVVRAGGALRLRVVERALAATYTWIDPSMRQAFDRAITDQGWAIAWVTQQALVPLAIVRPGGMLRRGQFTPLTPGTASIPLPD
jgi:hypothetical protein